MLGETSGEVVYLKESVLLARENPTKIIMKLVISLERENYLKLLSQKQLALRIATPLKIEDGSLVNLQYKLVKADLGKNGFLASEYRYLSEDDEKIAEKYIKAHGFPTDLPENKWWVGIAWKPREELEEIRFLAPLFAEAHVESRGEVDEILIDFSKFPCSSEEKRLNVGFMIEYSTRDIPIYRDNFMITNVDIYNKAVERSVRGFHLDREKILNMRNGELWVQYPLNAYLITLVPNPQSVRVQTIHDQKVAQESHMSLYGKKESEYLPAKGKIPARWDLDKHVSDWNSNEISFISVAFLIDDFKCLLLNEIRGDLEKFINNLRKDLIETAGRDLLRATLKPDEMNEKAKKEEEIQLVKGDNLISDGKRDRIYAIFAERLKQKNARGLCITNRTRDLALKKIDSEKLKIINLTTGKTDLEGLASTPEITREVESFVKQEEMPVILFDGLEFIAMRERDFDNIIEFLQALVELVRLNSAILLVPVDPYAFRQIELHQLKACFQSSF